MDGSIDTAAAPYEIRREGGREARPKSPLIFASPHSGRIYPLEMMAASLLDGEAIRRSEDVAVDELIAGAARHGATLILNRYARAFVDVNRCADELDPAMYEDALPSSAAVKGPRVAAGLGAVPRIVGGGQEIYNRKLTVAEATGRLAMVHSPYHAALADLVQQAQAAFGRAFVIDWHSMPSAAGRTNRGLKVDFVLGDRFGQSCDSALTTLAESVLRDQGYAVARNTPYAGGYTTEHYGRPAQGVHALQIEICRSLYLDEASLQSNEGFTALEANLDTLFAAMVKACAAA